MPGPHSLAGTQIPVTIWPGTTVHILGSHSPRASVICPLKARSLGSPVVTPVPDDTFSYDRGERVCGGLLTCRDPGGARGPLLLGCQGLPGLGSCPGLLPLGPGLGLHGLLPLLPGFLLRSLPLPFWGSGSVRALSLAPWTTKRDGDAVPISAAHPTGRRARLAQALIPEGCPREPGRRVPGSYPRSSEHRLPRLATRIKTLVSVPHETRR